MATDDARLGVHRHASVAALALLRGLAQRAEQRGREAAPIQEQQHLVPGLQVLLDRGNNGVDSDWRLAWRFKSTTRTCGTPALPTRRGRDSRSYRPCSALLNVSSDGVAEPSTIGTPSRCARTTARSRAE